MKISYSNYPMLKKLSEGLLSKMNIEPGDLDYMKYNSTFQFFYDQWKKNCNVFNSEINVVSPSFIEASSKALPKLYDLVCDIEKESTLSVCGSFLLKSENGRDIICMINYNCGKGIDSEIFYYSFDSKNCTSLKMFIHSDKLEVKESWHSVVQKFDNEEEKDLDIRMDIFRLISFSLFKQYADVETKILLPNTKLKTINTKYVNDTKLQLTYLDSKWFTTLVKSDAFKVSGHFRLQPYKDTKKLIWISDFEKTGYTAPAKKLNQIIE